MSQTLDLDGRGVSSTVTVDISDMSVNPRILFTVKRVCVKKHTRWFWGSNDDRVVSPEGVLPLSTESPGPLIRPTPSSSFSSSHPEKQGVEIEP